MAQSKTLTIRATLEGDRSIHRDIEVDASKSLYKLAEAIISSFGFSFDHAFGFYTGLTPARMMRVLPKYELFADMGEADPGVLSVKKTTIVQAFPVVGHTMLFLFDYGDEWHFRVSCRGTGSKVARVRYPRITASQGEAPEQYPDPETDAEDMPTYGVNPVTGEKIYFRR
jgi:Plasmid pRiA4b ORF-3-like protein